MRNWKSDDRNNMVGNKRRKNRQLIYLFLFLIAVAGIFFFEKENTTEYSPEMNMKYVNSILQGMEKILNKIPIDTIEEDKMISHDQVDRLLEGTERVFSGYLEMQAIGLEFGLFHQQESETEILMEHISSEFYKLKERETNELTDKELVWLRTYFVYLYDIYQIDLYEKELSEILNEMETVSKNYGELAEMTF